MARPRTATNVLALRGAYKNHPERKAERSDEPVPVTTVGPAPGHFTPEQTACYDELVRKAHAGVMCDSDTVVLEVGAVLLACLRADTTAFTAAQFGRLQGVLASLGMTPADRSRVKVIKKTASADPADEFAA